MNNKLIPTAEVPDDRKQRIEALTTALAQLLNDRDRTNEPPGLVLDALLNTYFIAAHSFGMLESAIDSAQRNAVAIAEIHGIRHAGTVVH